MAGLLATDEDTARLAIADLVYEDPASGELVAADEYLSGNVRAKLAAAEAAHGDAPERGWRRNIDALRAALPAELGPGQIDASLGAPWIDAGDVAAFIDEVLGGDGAVVAHDPLVAAWEVGVPGWRRRSVLMSSTWGTQRRSAVDLIDSALNQRPVTVWDTLPDDRRVVNETETMAARDKLEQLTERFRTWIWEDPARADRLCRIYNERFNSIVLRRFDGSHLQLPGLADWFTPHQHQLDAVWRIVSQGDVLLAHVVGAGKTATMVMAAMEMRRLGLVNKPCFVVPNHMLEQFTREFLQLYPQAKVLAANLGGSTPESRRRFVAQCATGDWDGVILPRESFRSIPVSRDVEERFLQRRVTELEEALSTNTGRPKVKELEKALARERARLQRLLNAPARDASVCFEETGLDYLFVDEGHGFKGKRIATRIPDVAGVESQRATDLDMKLDWLRSRTPGSGGHDGDGDTDRERHRGDVGDAVLHPTRCAARSGRTRSSAPYPHPMGRGDEAHCDSRWPGRGTTARSGSPSAGSSHTSFGSAESGIVSLLNTSISGHSTQARSCPSARSSSSAPPATRTCSSAFWSPLPASTHRNSYKPTGPTSRRSRISEASSADDTAVIVLGSLRAGS